MNEKSVESNAMSLVGKLIGCADEAADRFREKRGEDRKLPGYVRLLYSAAKVIQEQEEQLLEQQAKLEKAMAALSKTANCDTCRHGDTKKCPIRSECGCEFSLWEFDTE